jgi:hypothetical protein
MARGGTEGRSRCRGVSTTGGMDLDDLDGRPRQLSAQAHREGVDRGLGGGVHGGLRVRHEPETRADVDHARALRPTQQGERRRGDVDQAGEVGGDLRRDVGGPGGSAAEKSSSRCTPALFTRVVR